MKGSGRRCEVCPVNNFARDCTPKEIASAWGEAVLAHLIHLQPASNDQVTLTLPVDLTVEDAAQHCLTNREIGACTPKHVTFTTPR